MFAPGVIGLAGHVDHGKSALVRALTGVDPDRLKEEKERGMTTDLGFVSRLLSDGRRVGIIDVPGHERFIRHMIAGASAVKAVILAVAADGGVMPQTLEHLRIAGLLGIGDGLVALTRADLADSDLRAMAADDARSAVAGTFLDGKPVIPVSSVTREGMDLLEHAVEAMAARFSCGGWSDRVFRMPVLRSFTMEGHGLVLTGVPVSGCIEKGAELEVQGLRLRVKRIFAYGNEIRKAEGPYSIALNVACAGKGGVERGDVLCEPGVLAPSLRAEAGFRPAPGAEARFRDAVNVHFFHGSTRVPARMFLFGRGGEDSFAVFSLERPVFACPGDRYIVRLPSPSMTLGGGIILSVSGMKRKARDREASLAKRRRAIGTLGGFLECLVQEAGREGAMLADLRKATLASDERLGRELAMLEESCRIARAGGEGLYVSAGIAAEVSRDVMELLRRHFSENPLSAGVGKEEAAAKLALRRQVLDFAAEGLRNRGLIRDEGGMLSLPAPGAGQEAEGSLERRILDFLRMRGMSPSPVEEIARGAGATVEDAEDSLGLLLRSGAVAAVSKVAYVHSSSIVKAHEAVLGLVAAQGKVGSATLEQAIGVTNSMATAYLEFFERQGLLRRIGKVFVSRARG